MSALPAWAPTPFEALAVAFDAMLTQLILRFVRFTEIDWETYMAQVGVYIKGQRDYMHISGPTGQLVYPAGHVYIHHFLHFLTDGGSNLALSQQIYAILYVFSLILSCSIYRQAGGIPDWLVLVLPLSKRLHSIFVLRLFNDCWAVVAMQAAVLSYQRGLDDLGTLLFSAALSVKMSTLLYLPGLLLVLFKRGGPIFTLRHLLTALLIQCLLALPFLRVNPWSYLHHAFDLGRVFLYKWTVNWRFIPKEIFLSPGWAKSLLVGHASVLIAFAVFRWCRRDGGAWVVLDRGLRRPGLPTCVIPVNPDHVATVLFTSNLIGILFARSLHYQFYSWYAQQIPFLAWRTGYPLLIKIAIMLCIEYAWNVFPSTVFSSSLLFVANALLLIGIWFGYAEGKS